MADQTINRICLLRRWLAHVLPAIAGMARGATRLITRDRPAKRVDHMRFAQLLPGSRMVKIPFEMNRMHHLVAGFGMAADAGFGNLRPRRELLLEAFEFRMIRRARALWGGRFGRVRGQYRVGCGRSVGPSSAPENRHDSPKRDRFSQ